VETWHGSSAEAYRRYLGVAADGDAELAGIALSCAAAVAAAAGDLDAAQGAAERGAALSAADLGVREALGTVLALRGRRDAARSQLEPVARFYEARSERLGAEYVAQALVWLGEHDRARALLDDVIAQARRVGGVAVLCEALVIRADLGFRTGAWAAATADASESARLAEDTGQTVQLAYSRAIEAVLAAVRGEEAAREHAAAALALAQRHGLKAVEDQAAFALGTLELAAGRPDAALAHLEPLAAKDPDVLFTAADHIEAALEAGHPDRAAEALATLEERATGPWARGAALRCRGLLEPDDERFAQALEAHAGLPYEAARTRLCHGEVLRRAGRRVDARIQLRAALEAFERLGAAAWAERARRELAGSGERARPRSDPAAVDTLTAQELQIARAIADGATNREAGADLFLSPKTIETHLTRIYRKLGIRSRTELVRAL
jgi:DNA-binding CsgD family transcriptional regulator